MNAVDATEAVPFYRKVCVIAIATMEWTFISCKAFVGLVAGTKITWKPNFFTCITFYRQHLTVEFLD